MGLLTAANIHEAVGGAVIGGETVDVCQLTTLRLHARHTIV